MNIHEFLISNTEREGKEVEKMVEDVIKNSGLKELTFAQRESLKEGVGQAFRAGATLAFQAIQEEEFFNNNDPSLNE